VKIFVIGTGRCGTHSYAAALDKVMPATHEKLPNARHVSNRLWDCDITRNEAQVLVEQGLSQFERYVHWCDCNCLTWGFVDILYDILQDDVAFVHLTRDRNEVVESMFRTGFCAPGKYPWEKRAHSGFISYELCEYDDAMRMRNCIYAVDTRLECIGAALASIPQDQQITVELGGDGFEQTCRFIRQKTGLAFKTPSLPQLSRTK